MPPYRAGVIGLGWMGLLSDLGKRSWERYDIDDVERPTPELDAQRRFQYYSPQGKAVRGKICELHPDEMDIVYMGKGDGDYGELIDKITLDDNSVTVIGKRTERVDGVQLTLFASFVGFTARPRVQSRKSRGCWSFPALGKPVSPPPCGSFK